MPIEYFAFSEIIIFAGFFVLGLTGFGNGLIMLPFLLLFLDPKFIIPVSCLLGSFAVFYLAIWLWKKSRKELFFRLTIGAIVGIIIGTYGLIIIKGDTIRYIFAGLVILFALQILFERQQLQVRKLPQLIGLLVGLMAGITGALFGMGGPPVVWYVSRQTMDKEEFRATLVVFFSFTSIWILAAYAYSGLFTWETLRFSGYMLPAVVLGTLAGNLFHVKINQVLFRRVIAIILLGTSV